VSDIDTAVVDSLKALDLKRPIREADIVGADFPANRTVMMSLLLEQQFCSR
jgi:hypothetical protein